MKTRVTSFDVAKRAGVSRSVVSAVLNNTPGIGYSEEKRLAVLKAIKDLNYHVDALASGMRTGRSRCLAACDNLGNRFFLQMLIGMKETCSSTGYNVLMYGSGTTVNERNGLVQLYMQRRIDGIITKDSTSFSDPEWVKEIQLLGIPYISVEGYPEDDSIASVLMDYRLSMEMALAHIEDRKLPPPVFVEIYSPPEYRPNWGDRKRRETYVQWMERRGFAPRIVEREHNRRECLDEWWTEWLRRQEVPLTVLSNWSCGARHLYRAAYRLGLRIGEDLFIMSADNTEQSNEYLIPSLSSVEVPYTEMGAAAAARLLEYIEGERDIADTSKIYVPPRLEQRESTGSA